jgi:hypothetical protein
MRPDALAPTFPHLNAEVKERFKQRSALHPAEHEPNVPACQCER